MKIIHHLLVCFIRVGNIMALATLGKGEKYFLGFDLGTSGARISVIAPSQDPSTAFVEIHSDALPYKTTYDDPEAWRDAVHTLLLNTPQSILGKTRAICVSGTSASCLIVDTITGNVSRKPKMYNYDIVLQDEDRSKNIMNVIGDFAPPNHTVRSPTSTLAKLLHYHTVSPLAYHEKLFHQADYIANKLLTQSTPLSHPSISDWHNVLKLGYDIRNLEWPVWIRSCLEHCSIPLTVLPNKVISPGEIIGTIDETVSKLYGIHTDCVLVGGTTDSNAAFFAASADAMGLSSSSSSSGAGIAVTSLGSTLAIKMTSTAFIEDSKRGVYSHRFPSSFSSSNDSDPLWLVGGASNVGCAILRQEQYSNQELDECSRLIDPMVDSPLNYYPLAKQGERFPIADSLKLPIMEPKPKQNDRVEYLHAILQGIARVECQGYKVLGELGSKPSFPSLIWTCGGGSRNHVWTQMRQRLLQKQLTELDPGIIPEYKNGNAVMVRRALQSEASFGAAVLAASTFSWDASKGGCASCSLENYSDFTLSFSIVTDVVLESTMDHFACDELCANIDDGPVSMSAQRIEESNQECAKLRAENDSLRQSYLNVQASLNSLQNRYKETKNALIRQLDINRQKDDAFYEMEKRLSQRETSKIREPSRDDSSVIQSVIAEIPFEKKNEQGIKIDYLQKEVEVWKTKYYEVKRDHEIIQSKFDLLSRSTIKSMESLEEAKKADTSSFREKVLNLIQSHFRERTMSLNIDKHFPELQDANLTIQKLKAIEAQLRVDLMDATNKRKLEENCRIELETKHNVELAGAHGKIIILEKDISSLRMQLKSQRHQLDTLETVIKDNEDCISRFETVNQAMETELEKWQKKLVDSKMNYAVEQKQMQRISDSQIAVLQTRVNELEQSNTELTHQMTDLQCLIKKQKHDHILVLEQTIRESQSSLIKYRNDNTKLVVQVSNSEDLISSQEKSMNAEILRLQHECETYHQDSINWRNEANLMTSLLSSARASDESLKSSLIEAENKIMLIEGVKRDLEGKLNDGQQELSIMKDKNRILEERQCLLAHKCSSLQEQLQALQNAYDEDRIQMKTSFDDDRVRLQEDYRNKVDTLNTQLSKERRKSAAYKEKLLDAHRKNVEAKVALANSADYRWNN